MSKILLTEDELSIFGSIAGVFGQPVRRLPPVKRMAWKTPVECPNSRPDSWKSRIKQNRRKKRSRKSKRGY